jgi:hypothetical protein
VHSSFCGKIGRGHKLPIRNAQKGVASGLESLGGPPMNKENFYRGIRILLEIQRNGSSKLWGAGRPKELPLAGGIFAQ